ncbi:MAG: nuclear transport factor 2 family protein [Acidobacteriota bacterium]|nr:nuclear transport factor 2 family protein [Blastocatellia bacterium]MDW8239028.1 nuclear transport factor 2 family protein [Acidobacteriota bacterium]
MMTKKIFLVLIMTSVLTALGLTGAAQQSSKPVTGRDTLAQQLIALERESWQAYKSRNVQAIKALVAEDYRAYTQGGPSTRQEDIESIAQLTIESYSIDEPHIAPVTQDVAIIRYKCDLKGSFKGKPLKPVYATSVWVSRGGRWQLVSYQETPLSQ